MNTKRLIKAIFIMVLVCISLISYTNSPTPPAPYAGVPGESSCTSCHSGTIVNPSTSISISGLPTQGYTANTTYTLTITGPTQSANKNEFELTCLKASSLAMAGTLTAGANSGTTTANSHTYLRATANAFTSWTFTWTAPASGSGTCNFYVCYNASNGDGGSGGDIIHTATIAVNELANLPTADITVTPTSKTICLGDTFFLSGNGQNSPTSYTWTSVNGTSQFTSTNQNTYIVYTTTGSKSMKLTTANANGTANSSVTLFVNAKPSVPSISASNSFICAGDSISLSCSNLGVTFLWMPDNKTTSSIYIKDSLSHTVKITNTSQCSNTSNVFKTAIRTKPSVSLIASIDSTCLKDSISFTASSNASSFGFYFNDTLKSTLNSGLLKSKLPINGNNKVYVNATLNGCTTKSNIATVYGQNVLPAPSVSCGTNTANSVQFNWGAINGATSYQVSLDSGKTWINPNGTLSHTVSGLNPGTTVPIRVRGVDSRFCGNGNEVSSFCSNLNCPKITATLTHDNKVCGVLGQAMFSNIQVDIPNLSTSKYFLQIKDSLSIKNATKASIQVTPGLNNIRVYFLDSSNISCPLDTMYSLMAYAVKKPTLLMNNPGGIYCFYDYGVNLKTSKSNIKDSIYFLLTDPKTQSTSILAGGLDTFINRNIIVFNPGVNALQVKLVDNASSCEALSNAINLNRVLKSNADFASSVGTPTTHITFTDNTPSIAQVTRRVWSFGDNQWDSISNLSTVTHTYTPGSYQAYLFTADVFGCLDSVSHAINVSNTGIGSIHALTNVNIYPNPFTNDINITNVTNEELRISCIDVNGKTIKMFSSKEPIITWNAEDLKAGVYVIKIQNGQQTINQKLIKSE